MRIESVTGYDNKNERKENYAVKLLFSMKSKVENNLCLNNESICNHLKVTEHLSKG